MSASTGGVEAVSELLVSFPANCPPTIVLQQMEAGFADPFTAKLNEKIKPNVVVATDGLKLEQGTVYVVADPEKHAVIDRWPDASIRRSEEHTSELQSLMRISYAVFCLNKKKK